jgi:hypothetical protein
MALPARLSLLPLQSALPTLWQQVPELHHLNRRQ